jgi:hypothetical protein
MTDPLPVSPEMASRQAMRFVLSRLCDTGEEARSVFVGAVCDTEPGSVALPATWIVAFRQGWVP